MASQGNESRGVYRFGHRNRRAMLVLPSRRRPYGVYSLLDVSPDATTEEICRNWRRLCRPLHPDKTLSLGPHERSVATKKLNELNNAKDLLLDESCRKEYDTLHGFQEIPKLSSTHRVQKHREQLSKQEKRIVSAVETYRQVQNQSLLKRLLRPKESDRKFKKKLRVNVNNRHTRRGWIVMTRPKSALKKDRRLSKYCVSTAEQENA